MKISHRIFLIGIILPYILQAKIIHVPANQPSIQAGINNAVNGDTVLVERGTYIENIDFIGKNIVVGSLFLTTGDTSYISQTVIDGNNHSTVVTFKSKENNSALLTGFFITHGKGKDQAPTGAWPYDYIGGGITCRDSSNPRLINLMVFGNTAPAGAGICIRASSPELENVIISNNTSGGGIYCYYYSTPLLKNVTIERNTSDYFGGGIDCVINSILTLDHCLIRENKAEMGGGICFSDQTQIKIKSTTITMNTAFENGGGINGEMTNIVWDNTNRCNIYSNYSGVGSDVNSTSSSASIVVDTFTVANPSEYFASPLSAFTFDILHGKITQVNYDLYVNPGGNDNNSGQSLSVPLHSISFALTKIKADSLTPHTIHIANGTYKSSSGEHFPLNMRAFVSLSGESESKTILDAEKQGGVICFNSDQGITIENLTITGGSAINTGGGINCINSDPILKNLTISKNSVIDYGGGIYCANASPVLTNVTIVENTSSWGGGGLLCLGGGYPILKNVTFSRNSAKYWGGAMDIGGDCYTTLTNAILWNDQPREIDGNGTVTIEYSDVQGINAGTTNIDANPLFCNPLEGIYTLAANSPCINAGKDGATMGAWGAACGSIVIDTTSSVIYVSVSGSDALGSGSYDNPFATIQHALNSAKSGDTILAYPGTYHENIKLSKQRIILGSLFLTLHDTSYISNTILNGDTNGSVITINSSDSLSVICGFTITNGKAIDGGGIECLNSNLILSNLRIIGNTGRNDGGGLHADYSNYKLINSVVANNFSSSFGGGVYSVSSYPILMNVMIKDNISGGSGGGCSFYSSTPRLKNVTVTGNTAYYNGGGISLIFSYIGFDSSQRCNVYSNHAGRGSDVDFFDFDEGIPDIVLYADTFTVKNPTSYHVYRIGKFNILHGKINQSTNDLYVSSAGNDDNSGELPTKPLRTISFALTKILADSINPHTIFISDGVYSPSTTGEFFPLNMVNDVSLKGGSSDSVVLNAEGKSSILSFDSDNNITIENVSITGGMRFEGGGINCDNSSPSLKHVAITNNQSMGSGGGMVCSDYSNPILENCTISNNIAGSGYGGGIAFYQSCASLLNTIMWGNSSNEIYFFGIGYSRSCVTISYTDILDSTKRIVTNNNGDVHWQAGNFNLNPLFCSPDSGGYSLAENSPCIGTGKDGKNLGALRVGCGVLAVKSKLVNLPDKIELSQNYPNPFNPTTTINYQLPSAGHVTLKVFDLLGREVVTLVDGVKVAGYYISTFDGSRFSSGVYFVRMIALSQDGSQSYTKTMKMLMMK